MNGNNPAERVDTVIIGGGQAGLATGRELARRGSSFVILDASQRIGDAWRTRWDSLRLFTPAKYDGLPGWRFPAPGWSFPTKDELAATRPTLLAGKPVGEIPVRHGGRAARLFLPVIRFIGQHVLTVRTPIGRKVGPKLALGATPLIRVKSKDLAAAGVERVPRVVGVQDGLPVLEDGRVLEVTSVVWCTGFSQDYSWIDLPAFGEDGRPAHERGVAASLPGLYFVGLLFQYSVTSDVLPGVGRDAKRIAKHIARLDGHP